MSDSEDDRFLDAQKLLREFKPRTAPRQSGKQSSETASSAAHATHPQAKKDLRESQMSQEGRNSVSHQHQGTMTAEGLIWGSQETMESELSKRLDVAVREWTAEQAAAAEEFIESFVVAKDLPSEPGPQNDRNGSLHGPGAIADPGNLRTPPDSQEKGPVLAAAEAEVKCSASSDMLSNESSNTLKVAPIVPAQPWRTHDKASALARSNAPKACRVCPPDPKVNAGRRPGQPLLCKHQLPLREMDANASNADESKVFQTQGPLSSPVPLTTIHVKGPDNSGQCQKGDSGMLSTTSTPNEQRPLFSKNMEEVKRMFETEIHVSLCENCDASFYVYPGQKYFGACYKHRSMTGTFPLPPGVR